MVMVMVLVMAMAVAVAVAVHIIYRRVDMCFHFCTQMLRRRHVNMRLKVGIPFVHIISLVRIMVLMVGWY